jgi:hypothetical protein
MQAGRDNDGQDDRPPLLAPLGWFELDRGLAGRRPLCGHIRSVVIFALWSYSLSGHIR